LKVDYVYLSGRFSDRVPYKGVFLGSNDDSNWEVIKSFDGTLTWTVVSGIGVNTRVTGITNQNAYKYILLLVQEIVGPNTRLWLNQIQYYGHKENDTTRFPVSSTVLKYPHIEMTGPVQRGYVASASSNYSIGTPNFELRDFGAFNPAGTIYGRAWISGNGTYSSVNGTYAASPQKQHHTGSAYGEWLQIEMPHKIRVSHFILQGRPESLNGNQGLYSCFKTGEIWGSEDGTTWNSVVSGATFGTFTPSTLTQQYTITVNSSNLYKYFAIIVTSTNAQNTNSGITFACIGEWQIYGTQEDLDVVARFGEGLDGKVANFRVYDTYINEQQAMGLWYSQKGQFTPQTPTMTFYNDQVGIGTTTPGVPLDIKTAGDFNGIGLLGASSGRYILSTNSSGDSLLMTHGTYSWGRWTNAHYYDVYSAANFTGSQDLYLNYYSGAGVKLASGVVVTSDDRIKTEERYIENATETLLKLKPQIYLKGPNIGSTSNVSRIESGLIAQDVYYDAPELRHLVSLADDAEPTETKPYTDDDPQNDPDYSSWGSKSAGLEYEGLIAYLIKSNQELYTEIQAEKARNDALEARIAALENA